MEDYLIEEIKQRRVKLMVQCQEYIASASGMSPISPSQKGQMQGRSVSQISKVESKESRVYDRFAMSTKSDLVLDNHVNSTKKSEPFSLDKRSFA